MVWGGVERVGYRTFRGLTGLGWGGWLDWTGVGWDRVDAVRARWNGTIRMWGTEENVLWDGVRWG